jgi:hypothetical protein
MTKIMIAPGETLTIGFLDENGHEIDGEFQVHFDTKELPKSLLIKETAGLPGSILGKAEAVLYHEYFGDSPHHEDEVDATESPPSHT